MLKRMKRLLRLRNKSGFTLVEVIIACALLGVLIIGVMGFATPVLTSVRAKEQNARAVMLSEAIDNYIANSIQYAFYVQTFSEVTSLDTRSSNPNVLSMTYNGKEFEKQVGKGLSDMLNCLNNDLAGGVFEIRCIGVRWLEVPGSGGEKKLMLTNEKVNQTNCSLDPNESRPVFESVFYDGLYPIIKLENYSNQYQLKDEHGVPQNQVKDEDVDVAPGLRIVTDVYLSPECYSVNENVRKSATLSFSGRTYADLPNIRSNLLNNGVFKIRPCISAHTVTNALGEAVPSYSLAYSSEAAGSEYRDDNGLVYYYPNSFIYYIARKAKTDSTPLAP